MSCIVDDRVYRKAIAEVVGVEISEEALNALKLKCESCKESLPVMSTLLAMILHSRQEVISLSADLGTPEKQRKLLEVLSAYHRSQGALAALLAVREESALGSEPLARRIVQFGRILAGLEQSGHLKTYDVTMQHLLEVLAGESDIGELTKMVKTSIVKGSLPKTSKPPKKKKKGKGKIKKGK
jgi:hypothetical protein